MDVLENILENILSLQCVKTGTKRRNENKLEKKFIGFRGEEI